MNYKKEKKSADRKRLVHSSCFDEAQNTLFIRYGIVSSFLGFKETDGKLTRQLSLVCAVPTKKPIKTLDKKERIPKRFSYRYKGKTYSIKTDVIPVRSRFYYQAKFNPGDRLLHKSSQSKATVGAYAGHKTLGNIFITAGHFAKDSGGKGRIVHIFDNTIKGANVRCKVLDYALNEHLDYALLRPQPINGNTNNTYSDASLDTVYQPSSRADIGQKLFVITRAKAIPTKCIGVRMRYKVNANFTLRDLTVTPRVTKPGDSGAALVDEKFRIWGFLIGAIGTKYSVFMPAIKLISHANVTFGE